MSDTGSLRSAKTDTVPDQVLDDHRNQLSLPVRVPEESMDEDDPRYPSYYDDDDYIPIVHGSGGSLAAAARRGRSGSKARSHSFSEQIRCLVNPKEPQGILKKKRRPKDKKDKKKEKKRAKSVAAFKEPGIYRVKSERKEESKEEEKPSDRRASKSSIDSEDSQASRSSQETEEDVCFPPMLREHVRIKGIDFDEIEEFIKEERDSSRRMREQQQMIAEQTKMRVSGVSTNSSAMLRYTPKHILGRMRRHEKEVAGAPGVPEVPEVPSVPSVPVPEAVPDVCDEKTLPDSGSLSSTSSVGIRFGGARITDSAASALPDRFSFFSSESEETVHAPDLPSLVGPGESVRELFRNGESTWWLDCVCPTDAEMKTLARAFGIHPLTAEDIRMQETREKVELFRNYYFVCFHTFEPDKESEDYLEPINVYLVVFRDGVLSFHFSPISHPASVRRRVRQLRDYVDVSADWICYAMIDDITDEFAPVITAIEYEADAIEDSVFVARDTDFSTMLQRIGESRKKVMTLMRLLSGKADVIKMFAKRCQEEREREQKQPEYRDKHDYRSDHVAQPRADIALYLGDIQDHVVTMFQNLLAYEKIFSRSHSNYLAQLQVESFNSNNRVTEMFSKVTLIGTILVPLNLVTGLFGMNVKVPGEGVETLQWFFGILGFMVLMIIVSFVGAKFWIDSAFEKPQVESSRRSIRSFGIRRSAARSVLSFPNKYD